MKKGCNSCFGKCYFVGPTFGREAVKKKLQASLIFQKNHTENGVNLDFLPAQDPAVGALAQILIYAYRTKKIYFFIKFTACHNPFEKVINKQAVGL